MGLSQVVEDTQYMQISSEEHIKDELQYAQYLKYL